MRGFCTRIRESCLKGICVKGGRGYRQVDESCGGEHLRALRSKSCSVSVFGAFSCKRERERERDRQTDRQRKRQIKRQRERERERERQRERDKERDRER